MGSDCYFCNNMIRDGEYVCFSFGPDGNSDEKLWVHERCYDACEEAREKHRQERSLLDPSAPENDNNRNPTTPNVHAIQ